jgi:hypothetical protein
MGAGSIAASGAASTRGRVQIATIVTYVFMIVGLVLLNWWVAIPFMERWPHSIDGLMSDFTATGGAEADTIRLIELVACAFILMALAIRGPLDRQGVRRADWWCVIGLVAFEAFDAIFVEACMSGIDDACFDRETHFALPVHHYFHVVGGILEWTFALGAAWYGWKRLRGTRTFRERTYFGLLIFAAVIVAPLATAFVTHRLFAVVEFFVYIAFTILIVFAITEPGPDSSGGPQAPVRAAPTDDGRRQG